MCKQIGLIFAISLGLLSAANGADTADILWLSDKAPKRARTTADAGHGGGAKHQESMDAVISGDEGDNLHSGTKRLWVRRGADPANASYVDASDVPTDIGLLDAKGNRSQIAQTPANGLAHAKCEFSELGFYNAYLTRESLADGVKRVQLAKAELLKGSCCMKTGDVDPAQMRAITNPELPLEVVREHEPDEKLFTRITSGDKIKFTVNRQGKPTAGVAVTMLTQQGWQKKAVSDANGQVEFTMIRDYFPSWSDFKRRTKETFLIVADVEDAASGTHEGRPYAKVAYQSTLSGRYAPSPYDYKSYAWGLGISVFVLAFGGLGVYLYRRRRLRPFKEVRFNESA